MKFVNIGFHNVVVVDHIVALIALDSSPVRRLRDFADEKGRLIDATCGRKTRTLIITESHHIILSAFNIETLAQRITNTKKDTLQSLKRKK